MLLDVRKLGRVLERRVVPVEVPQPLVDVRVAGADVANVALEVLHVDGVEADDGREESDVGLGDRVAKVVLAAFLVALRKVGFGAVERGEERRDVALVRFLRGGEAGFVDAVVDVVVGPGVCFFNLGLELCREEVYVLVLVLDQVVKLVITVSV